MKTLPNAELTLRVALAGKQLANSMGHLMVAEATNEVQHIEHAEACLNVALYLLDFDGAILPEDWHDNINKSIAAATKAKAQLASARAAFAEKIRSKNN